MEIVNIGYNVLLGAMSGITVLGLSSSKPAGLTGALAIFLAVMMLDLASHRRIHFHRRL